MPVKKMLSSKGTAWYWCEGFFFSSFNSSIIRRTPVFFKENFDDMVNGKNFRVRGLFNRLFHLRGNFGTAMVVACCPVDD